MSSAQSLNLSGTNETPSLLVAPQLGSQLVTLAFVVVGTLATIVWDILSNINTDYHILCHFSVTLTTAVYFASRVATLMAFILIAIVNTQPMSNCNSTMSAVSWVMAISLSLTTLLFLLRVRAFYMDRKYVVGFFFVSWLAVVAGCIAETQTGADTGIVKTMFQTEGFCISNPVDILSLVTTMSTIPMVNDILSFCAITWRLLWISQTKTTFKSGLKTVVLGRNLPALSKVLLQDGQIYFASTVSLSLLSTIAYYCKSIPRIYSVALVFPNVAVMNLMGCRIFRNTKISFKTLTEPSERTLSQPIAFRVPTSQGDLEDAVV